MKEMIYRGLTAAQYAMQACDTMMARYDAADLPPKGHFHYHQGVFLSGVQRTYELTGQEKYYEYAKKWVDSLIGEDGAVKNFDPGQLDDIQPGILLYQIYERTGEERYHKALNTLAGLVRDFPRNAEGGFWHKEGNREQMWLDGLYMGGPICTRYAAVFHQPEFYDIAAFQALLMEKKTKDPVTGLWYHAWDSTRTARWADPETGLSSQFWGRSIGWVPVAVLDELDDIPAQHKDRKELERLVGELLTAVCAYQDSASGLWYQVTDKGGMEGNWLESSCTCLFVAAICKAVRKGILDEKYLEQAVKGYRGIIDRLKYRDGQVIIDNICVGTGVGDYAHYCSRPTSENDLHGVGAYLLMCTEAGLV